MKRIFRYLICLVVSLFLFSACSLTVFADDTDDQIAETIEGMQDIVDTFVGDEGNQTKGAFEKAFETLNSFTNFGWNLIYDTLTSDSYGEINTNYNDIISVLSGIFKLVGSALCALFFVLNVNKSLIKYAEWNSKIVRQLFFQLIATYFFVILSCRICMLIYDTNASLVNLMLTGVSDELVFYPFKNEYPEGANIFGIQYFIDAINTLLAILPQLIVSILMSVLSVIVIIKLAIRKIECICMISMSPLFFGCLGAERTRRYFANFMANFVNVVIETAFMSIVYITGMDWWNTRMENLLEEQVLSTEGAVSFITTAGSTTWIEEIIVLIAIMIMMLYPPRILRSTINVS